MSSLRLSIRRLASAPGFTATVVLVLALGVGATTAIFSVVHAVLLYPFPYPDAGRILFVACSLQSHPGHVAVTYPDYLDWRERNETFEYLGFASGSATALTDVEEPAVLANAAVSASVWPMLGIPPALGRVFTEEENQPQSEPVCVLPHATWQGQFGGDPEIVGRSITLDEKSFTVIGVMPPEFKFWGADIWTPVGLQADTDMMRSRMMRHESWVVGRLKPGKSFEDATTDLKRITAQLAQQYPDSNKDVRVLVQLLSNSVTGEFRRPLLILLAAVGCVLLIACANVANLLLARTATRQREFAVRVALGATRAQLVREMLLESLPLALLGGLAGLLLGVWGLQALLLILPPDAVPAEAQIGVNGTVMLFSLAVTLGTMLLFALIPALESSRPNPNGVLQEGHRTTAGLRTSRVRAALIVTEICLSLTLLVGAGLLIRSLARLYSIDPGFDARNLLVMRIPLPGSRYLSSQQASLFIEDVLQQLRPLPGIVAAAASSNVPFSGGISLPLLSEGRTYQDPAELDIAQFAVVMGDHLRAQGLRLRKGRMFHESDRAGAQPVVILNEAAVHRFLPEGDALGARVKLGMPENLNKPGLLPPGLDRLPWATVIGVVQSARHFNLRQEPPPAAYFPLAQVLDSPLLRSSMFLLVRTQGDPLKVVPAVRDAVAAVNRDQPIDRIATMDMIIGQTLGQSRFNTLLLALFAAVALTLAVVGVYGIVAWNVAQRTREIGIRQALGADRNDVLRLITLQSMRIVTLGLLLGVLSSLAVSRTLHGLLYEISAFDPWTLALVALTLALSALVACLLPTQRATRVDPLVALRSE